jgi:hypothetical protein
MSPYKSMILHKQVLPRFTQVMQACGTPCIQPAPCWEIHNKDVIIAAVITHLKLEILAERLVSLC